MGYAIFCPAMHFERDKILELYTDLVFWYEPFGIFLVFTIPIPKENLVSIFGILKLAGASYTWCAGGEGGLQFVRGE